MPCWVQATAREGEAVAKVGRKVQYERLTPVGIYLDEALRLANMTRAELARRAGMEASIITRVCNGERTVGRNTLLEWCSFVACPEWLETLFLNAAGYASREQETHALQQAQAILSEALAKLSLDESPVS